MALRVQRQPERKVLEYNERWYLQKYRSQRYLPHQGAQEKVRRVRQMEERKIDTSDIPEVGEDFFRKAKLVRLVNRNKRSKDHANY